MIIFVWIAFALFWLYALFSKERTDALMLGLFFLWIVLAYYFIKSQRAWKKIDEARRAERYNHIRKVENET